MRPLKSILVGVDFTPGCKGALREGIRIAKAYGASLYVLHVIDTQISVQFESALTAMQESIRDGLIKDAQTAWAQFAADVTDAQCVHFQATIEHRVSGLADGAREKLADLIVLGMNSSGHPDVGIGTVATSCVRHCPADVLLVRPDHAGTFDRIVVGIDFSPTSMIALERALQLVAPGTGQLLVVHVFEGPWTRLHYRAPTVPSDPRTIAQVRSELSRQLEAFVAAVAKSIRGVKMTHHVEESSGHRSGLMEFADREGADLVCLGTRGHSNLRDFMLGSTAEKVLMQSRCSVLAVKPD